MRGGIRCVRVRVIYILEWPLFVVFFFGVVVLCVTVYVVCIDGVIVDVVVVVRDGVSVVD